MNVSTDMSSASVENDLPDLVDFSSDEEDDSASEDDSGDGTHRPQVWESFEQVFHTKDACSEQVFHGCTIII